MLIAKTLRDSLKKHSPDAHVDEWNEDHLEGGFIIDGTFDLLEVAHDIMEEDRERRGA